MKLEPYFCYDKHMRLMKLNKKSKLIMSIGLVLILLCTCGVVAWGNLSHQVPKSWIAYEESDVPFILDYPNSWRIEKDVTKSNKTNETTRVTLRARDTAEHELLSIEYSRNPGFSAGGTACQINSKSPNCIFLSNAISEGSLNKRENVWVGKGKGSAELIVLISHTDLQTTETLIKSLRRK
jgi:hypothetical protein